MKAFVGDDEGGGAVKKSSNCGKVLTVLITRPLKTAVKLPKDLDVFRNYILCTFRYLNKLISFKALLVSKL